jgi:predicted DNA-binding transcriptional regulator
MSRDRVIGAALLLVSAAIVIAYIWLVFFPPITGVDLLLLKLTGAVAIAGVFGILGWIGYTLATTPPPKPIEDIEKEIEEEMKKMEEEMRKEEGKE